MMSYRESIAYDIYHRNGGLLARAGQPLAGKNLSGAELNDMDLSLLDLNEVNLAGAHLNNCYFNCSKMRDVNLDLATITNCSFKNVDLRLASFTGTIILKCSFNTSNLSSAYMVVESVEKTSFDYCELTELTVGGRWENISMREASGQRVAIGEATLISVIATRTRLPNSYWNETGATDCSFFDGDLYSVILRNCVFTRCDFRETAYYSFNDINVANCLFDNCLIGDLEGYVPPPMRPEDETPL